MKITRITKPVRMRKGQKRGKQKESVVKGAIAKYLALQGTLCLPISVTAPFSESAQRYVRVPKAMRGMADLLVLSEGRATWIETKAGKGRQRPEQKEFQRKVERAGCVYILAYSVDVVIPIFPMPRGKGGN